MNFFCVTKLYGILNHNLTGQHKRLLEILRVPLKHYYTGKKKQEDAEDGLNWTLETQRLTSL